MLVFYDFTPAPSPRRARIFLAEKGIETETVQVNLRTREQLGEAYRAINPQCTVPALKLEDGTILTENAGIFAFAEAFRPDPPLLGRTPTEKGLVATWNARIEQEGFAAVAEALRNSSPAMKDRALTGPIDYPQIPELAERGKRRLEAFLDMLDARLAGRDHVAVDTFSLADITGLVVVDFGKMVKIEPRDDHTNLRRWHATVSARPSVGRQAR